METVVILSPREGHAEKLKECVRLLFPECQVLILPRDVTETPEAPCASSRQDKEQEPDHGQHPDGG